MWANGEFDEQFKERLVFAEGVRRRVEPSSFVVVWSPVVRRRQSTGVGVGVFGGGSVCVRETHAAKTRASRRNPREVLFLFHLGFWGVCVCVCVCVCEASSSK